MISNNNNSQKGFLDSIMDDGISLSEKKLINQLESSLNFIDRISTSFFGVSRGDYSEVLEDADKREKIVEDLFPKFYELALKRLPNPIQNKYLCDFEFISEQQEKLKMLILVDKYNGARKWFIKFENQVKDKELLRKNELADNSKNQEIKEKFQDVYEELSQELGREASHEDLVRNYISIYGKDRVKAILPGLEKASKLLNKQVTDTSELFLTITEKNALLLKSVLFEGNNSEQTVLDMSKVIFMHAINLSVKKVTFEYVTNEQNLFHNPELLEYASIFRSLRNTVSQHANNSNGQMVRDSESVALESYNVILNSIIQSINQI